MNWKSSFWLFIKPQRIHESLNQVAIAAEPSLSLIKEQHFWSDKHGRSKNPLKNYYEMQVDYRP